jgi:flagellar hook-length control protein FliK
MHQLAPTLITLAQSDATSPVELTLAPEELGRLRLHMVPQGDAIHVILSAERPDTVDLLRRNADHLIAELRQSGFTAPSFSFGTWGDAPQQRFSAPPNGLPNGQRAEADASQTPPAPPKTIATGLDLRL